MKKVSVISLGLLLAMVISACSAGASSSASPQAAPSATTAAAFSGAMSVNDAGSVEYPAQVSVNADTSAETASLPDYVPQPSKIIKTGSVELTTNNFDADKARLENMTGQFGGFIESSRVYDTGNGRRYEAVLRVPGEHFAEMKKAAEETGVLISSNESEQDVTGQYYDAQGRLEAKRVEETRVLGMIDQADNIDTQLSLEEYLGRLRTDIDVLEAQIKDIDDLSSYSTLNVNMTEGVTIKLTLNTGGFGQKLLQNFKASANGTGAFFGNILVILAGAAIPLLLIALVALAGVIAYKKIRVWNGKERVDQ